MAEDRDTFVAVIALIGMALDPKACAARLAELRQQVEVSTKVSAPASTASKHNSSTSWSG
jgi:hypothetical protein